jgi:hypothetical protein
VGAGETIASSSVASWLAILSHSIDDAISMFTEYLVQYCRCDDVKNKSKDEAEDQPFTIITKERIPVSIQEYTVLSVNI